MAGKDITEKILMSHADVFADCVNALAYGGRERLLVGELQPAPTESFYQGKKKMRNQFCDKSFFRVKDGGIKAQYIIENETRLRRRQVLKKASYQGGAYREQLYARIPVYPVISMALDWTQKRSRIPLSIHKLAEENEVFPEEMQLADDVKLAVYHMRNLPKEVREGFTSDMGFVVDYLNEGTLESRREQRIVHVRELCEMMEEISGDCRFTELMDELLERKEEEEEVRMCEYLDMLEARGQERGERIGQARGEQIGQERGERIGQERGERIGQAKGEQAGLVKGENRLAKLIQFLLRDKKYSEIDLASRDSAKRQEMYRLYGL